jgi:hypothetical protein
MRTAERYSHRLRDHDVRFDSEKKKSLCFEIMAGIFLALKDTGPNSNKPTKE